MCFSLESTSEFGVNMYELGNVSHDLFLCRCRPPGGGTRRNVLIVRQKTPLYQRLLCYDKCKVRTINNAV